MEVKEIKILRKLFLIFTVIFLLVFFLISECEDEQAQNSFLERNLNGIVEDIHYKDFNWGYPEYKVNGKWIFFGGFFEYSEEYIDIGDSLVKEKGDITVKVYSKNNKGDWFLKYPRDLKQKSHKDSSNKNRIPLFSTMNLHNKNTSLKNPGLLSFKEPSASVFL